MTEESDPSAQPGEQSPPGNQPPTYQPPPGNQPPTYPPPPGEQPPQQPPGYPPQQQPPGYPPPQQPPGYPPAPTNLQKGYPPPGNQPPPGYPPPGSQPPGYPAPGGAQPGYGYPAAPMAPQGTQYGPGGTVFDPASGLYLPPGTQLASHGRRIGAYFLAIPLLIVTLVIGYIVWGIIAWTKGTTPALQTLGMKCYLPETGRVPGFWRMVLREVVGRIAEGILSFITLLISFILFLATAKRQALHDLIGGTVVLHDPNKVLG